MLDDGGSLLSVAELDFGAFCRYNRAFSLYRNLRAEPRSFQTQCIVLYGPSGSGKTRAAASYDPGNTFFLARPRDKHGSVWWNGYDGQRTIVVDEFYGWLQRDFVQRLIDRYPLRLEVKGDTVQMRARTVFITSNVPPPFWWRKIGLGAMQRRLVDPVGAVLYVGDSKYPTEESYLAALGPADGVIAVSDTQSRAHGYRASSFEPPIASLPS